MDSEAKILKFPADNPVRSDGVAEQEGSASGQSQSATGVLSHAEPPEPPPPVWMQRFFLITTVVFCLWIGFVLAVLPWQPAWTENALVNNSPNLRWFLGTGFMRGLASGLGLLDLWIGISEAVHYRDRR